MDTRQQHLERAMQEMAREMREALFAQLSAPLLTPNVRASIGACLAKGLRRFALPEVTIRVGYIPPPWYR